MKKNTFIEGTLIASIAIIITKILGVLYVIPFYKIIGEQGGVLYSYAYNIYNLFLNISTAGIPIAISMIISEYTTLKMYDAKTRAYKIGKKIIFAISFTAFLILMIFANYFAGYYINGIEGGNTIKDIALVIRAISLCLLITPFLSVLRGYLQGNKYIKVSSISQIIEQIVRIIVILLGSYIAINILHKQVKIGVAISLSGAFIGGIIAYLYLKLKINKNKKLFEKSETNDNITNKEITKKIITYCVPLIIISIVNNIYDLIDMKLIIKGLYKVGYDAKTSELISSIVYTWGPKICMIIMAIAMGLTTSLIPHIVNSYTKKDIEESNKKFNQAISTMIITTVPMAIGLCFLSENVYNIFYGTSEYGPSILKCLSIYTIFCGTLLVINTALQGLQKFKIIYLNTISGLVVNTILDIPMIFLLHNLGLPDYYGTIVASMIGCSVSYIIVLIYLKKNLKFNYKLVLSTIYKTILPTISMTLVLIILKKLLPIDNNINLIFIIKISIYIILSAITYISISYYNKNLENIFEKEYINKILKKLHIKSIN